MTFPVLYHFSSELLALYGHDFKKDLEKSPFNEWKPCGMWLTDMSEPDNWFDWCNDNEFRLDQLEVCTEVVIKPAARVRWIKTYDELLEFEHEYGIDNERLSGFNFPKSMVIHPDWRKVMDDYDGIIITPYQWQHRMSLWYNTWDVASGCVWNDDVIQSMKVVDVEQFTRGLKLKSIGP